MAKLTLTDTIRKKILKALSIGMSQAQAFGYAGVESRTAYYWLAAGRKHIDAGDTSTPQAKLVKGMNDAKGAVDYEMYEIMYERVTEDRDFNQTFAFQKHRENRDFGTGPEAGQGPTGTEPVAGE